MPTDREIDAAARAMSNSKAWPAVFQAGAANALARAALDAAERIRAEDELETFGAGYPGVRRHSR